MKLIEMTVEGIKKIKAVRIEFKDNVTIISGRNGQGKSSAIDAIAYALCGKEILPEKVIREGEEQARVILRTDEYIITRHWTSNDKSYLKVQTLDGATYPSPQGLLNRLIGNLSFDPVTFIKDKDQVTTLKRLVGLDFSNIDLQISEATEQRKLIGRERDKLKLCLSEMPEVSEYAGLPDEEILTEDILSAKKVAEEQLRQNAIERHRLDELKKEYTLTGELIAEKEMRIKHLESEIEILRMDIATAKKHLGQVEAEGKSQKEKVSLLKEIDLSEFDRQLVEMDHKNRLIRAKMHRSSIENALGDKVVEYDSFTEKISGLKQQKLDLLKTAKFPVPGLSLEENVVTYNGIPVSQASQAEQIRIGFAVAMALNPELKVITVKDASLLDKDNIQIIRDMAVEKDYLVILERVEEEEGSIIIEEGEIKCQQQS